MDVKSLAQLFLCLSVRLQIAWQMNKMQHECNTATLRNCNMNLRIQVTKFSDSYKLRLCNNNSSECLTGSNKDWIKCDQVCDACKGLLSQPSQQTEACPAKNKTVCEKQVDKFLNAYCASTTLTHSTERVICRTVTDQQTSVYVTSTFTKTVSPVRTFSPGPATSAIQCTQRPSSSVENLALGVVFGMSLMLTVVVIIGWICTYWIMKNKRETMKTTARNRTVDVNTQNEHENYAYAGISMTERCPPKSQDYEIPVVVNLNNRPQVNDAMYDVVIPSHESTESGQDYDKFKRTEKKENGGQTARGLFEDNYSKLSIHQDS